MATGRIQRLLRLITLLESGRARSVNDLMAELSVSRRTLFRDLRMIQAAGIPCYFENGSGYRMARTFNLEAPCLTVPETVGLMLLGKLAAAQMRRPFTSAALSAINKLAKIVPADTRQVCADLTSRVSIDLGAQGFSETEVKHYPTLQRAMDEGRRCRMIYQSPAETRPLACLLEPFALHFAGKAWYVLGRTDRHREVRIFKLARIQSLELTENHFTKPKRFKVSDVLGKAWSLNPEGRIYRVALLFEPKVAINVSEIRWHPSQQHQMLPDGRCRVSFEIDGLNEISWWICGYADQVTVLEPLSLKRLVQDMHLRACQHSAKTEVPTSPINIEPVVSTRVVPKLLKPNEV